MQWFTHENGNRPTEIENTKTLNLSQKQHKEKGTLKYSFKNYSE